MKKLLAVFMPGEFVARKIDKGHAKFVERIKRRDPQGQPQAEGFPLPRGHGALSGCEVGLAAGYLDFFFLVPIAFALWPLVALGDLRLWKSARIYEHIALRKLLTILNEGRIRLL